MTSKIRDLLEAVDDVCTRLDVGYTINTAELRQLAAAVREEMGKARQPIAPASTPWSASGTLVTDHYIHAATLRWVADKLLDEPSITVGELCHELCHTHERMVIASQLRALADGRGEEG